jgi:glycoprotease/Kae1 family metallohydrolase
VAPAVRAAPDSAEVSLDDIDRVAVTQGPGLVGALLVGISAAKAIAWGRELPLAPVDHLEGHVASLYLEPNPVEPPFTCLLASGGHTLLLAVPERGRSERLGTTLDDAAGEAFDKGARLLGLVYPGGAAIDRLAREGDADAFDFPLARVPSLDFSFSGLKTALLYAVRDLGAAEAERRKADLAASYQRAIVRALVRRLEEAASASGFDRVSKLLFDMGLTHPLPVRRTHELLTWVRSGDYDRVVAGEYVRRGHEPGARDEAAGAAAHYAGRVQDAVQSVGQSVNDVGKALGDWLSRQGGGGA